MSDILDRARKLLRLRERAATPGEAQAAARALAKLLDKHRITIASLEMSGAADAQSMFADKTDPLLTFTRLPGWKSHLIKLLCRHYGVAYWRRKSTRGADGRGRQLYSYAIHLCGREDDVAVVRQMFAWLSVEATRLSHGECEGRGAPSHNSWRRGFVAGIGRQLTGARAEVSTLHADAAMALRNRYDDAREFMRESVEGLRFATRRRKWWHDKHAHAAGKQRGESQHLGDKISDNVVLLFPEAS